MPLRLVAHDPWKSPTGDSVGIWEQWLRESPETRTLPAILPVVLYHGRHGAGAWSAARSLEELYDLDEETSRAAGEGDRRRSPRTHHSGLTARRPRAAAPIVSSARATVLIGRGQVERAAPARR